MKRRFVKISAFNIVDRRKTAGLFLNPQTMKPVVFQLGMPPVESDYTLDETAEILETGEQRDLPKADQ